MTVGMCSETDIDVTYINPYGTPHYSHTTENSLTVTRQMTFNEEMNIVITFV